MFALSRLSLHVWPPPPPPHVLRIRFCSQIRIRGDPERSRRRPRCFTRKTWLPCLKGHVIGSFIHPLIWPCFSRRSRRRSRSRSESSLNSKSSAGGRSVRRCYSALIRLRRGSGDSMAANICTDVGTRTHRRRHPNAPPTIPGFS